MPITSGSRSPLGVVGVHQVDASGNGSDVVNERVHVQTGGKRMTGVQAESDVLSALCRTDRLPGAGESLQSASHGVLSAGGVLHQQRHREVEPIDGLAPVVLALLDRFALTHVPAMHDDTDRPDLSCGVEGLLDELSTRDTDPVVERGEVDDERGMDHHGDTGLLRRLPDGLGPARVVEAWLLPRLGIRDRHLGQIAQDTAAKDVVQTDVGTDGMSTHGPRLTRESSAAVV